MELEKGYKQTEIGLIPKDWDFVTVDEIAKISTGDKDTQNKIDDGNYPFFVRSQIVEKINSYSFDGEAVLTSGDGVGVGKIFHYVNGKFDYHQRVYNIHDFSNCKGKYFYYYFSINFYDRVMQMTAKSSVDSVRREMISKMKIPLPPTIEQQAIAQVLTDTDQLIQNLKTLIAKKKAIKQGAMQELLTPKKNWKTNSLFELAENKKELFDDGDWIEAEHITNKGIRLVQTGNIGIGSFNNKKSKKYIYENSFEKLKCKELIQGDILISRLAEPAGRACIFPKIDDTKTITSVDVTIFRPSKKIVNRIFLVNIFTTNEWFKTVNESVGGTTHKRISRGALGKIKIQLPSLGEQNRVAQILSDMDAEIEGLEKQLQKTQALKQGMMQELLTGKTRLIQPITKKKQNL